MQDVQGGEVSTIFLSADTLKTEIMGVVSLIEDGDLTGALRSLRALYISTELQVEMQRNTLEQVEKALGSSKKYLKAVEDEP